MSWSGSLKNSRSRPSAHILGDASNRKNAVTDEGHLATFLQIYSEQQLSNMGNAVNKDYMDATGLDLPTTINE